MSSISDLNPQPVWNFFQEITQIPRPSKKEEKIINYLIEFGKKHKLETIKDEVGNILIKKDATPGKENVKPIVLQSHMDMVCEKNSDTEFNFETDPINAYIDGEWVKAKGTTLGADNGIGMAYQLALLSANNIPHGPIECLITIDEETGMTGAKGMQPGFINARTFINLDTEEDDEICIGCAGGIDSMAYINFTKEDIPKDSVAIQISVSGLKGGHSSEIDQSPGNANKILNRLLWNLKKEFDIKLSLFDGGNLRNAIPREAFAKIVVPKLKKDKILSKSQILAQEIKNELISGEPGIDIKHFEENELPDFVVDNSSFKNFLNSVYAAPNGVMAYSMEMEGLIETSTNLASVKFIEDNKIKVSFLSRSAINSAKHNVANTIESAFTMIKAQVNHTGAYPGWAPNMNSEILKTASEIYKKSFNADPKIVATHGGLECGLILEKNPGLDLISFGPTMKDVHSPNERINIKSVEKTWKFLLEVLNNI